MRIVVISDSHKKSHIIDKILSSQPDALHVFFLGDVIEDIEDYPLLYPEKTFHIVSGNCDWHSTVKSVDLETVDGVKILYTHGHNFYVKGGVVPLIEAAKKSGCKIALYGHTHTPQILYEDGLYVVNPGSCSQSRNGPNSYAIIDITDKGIMPIIIEL